MTSAMGPKSAHSPLTDSAEAADDIIKKLGALSAAEARCILFFAGLRHNGAVIGQRLSARFPLACVAGCSSNGEFTQEGYGQGGVVALVLGDDMVGQVASALAAHEASIEAGVYVAAETLSQKIGTPIRALDPQRYIGVALLEGAKGREEKINEALGNVAPFLAFVGGSSGDDISFTGTWVYADGKCEVDASALLILELRRPFSVLKTCNFIATSVEFTVTKADTERRLIHELDGQPAAKRYAEAIGAKASDLGFSHFLANPLGLMIDGEPWLRSGVRTEGDSLFFACSVLEGMNLQLMQATDIVEDARRALERSTEKLGTTPRAALLFNCAYRMLEVRIKGVEADYHRALSQVVHAGIHSNGESYLGHINQTLTGIVIG